MKPIVAVLLIFTLPACAGPGPSQTVSTAPARPPPDVNGAGEKYAQCVRDAADKLMASTSSAYEIADASVSGCSFDLQMYESAYGLHLAQTTRHWRPSDYMPRAADAAAGLRTAMRDGIVRRVVKARTP